MKNRNIITVLLVAFILASCVPSTLVSPIETIFPTASPLVTDTPFPTQITTPSPILTLTPINIIVITLAQSTNYYAKVSYPPCEPINHSYFPNTGCLFQVPIIDSSKKIDLGNSYQLNIVTPIDGRHSLVTILKDGKEIYKIKIQRYTFSGLVGLWGYDDHWVIEIATPNGFDVIQDGESLKAKYKYDEVCGFQILGGKPFYFFKKTGFGYGMNYDGVTSPLDYAVVMCNSENPNVDPNVAQFQNAVYFAVNIDGAWKPAVIKTNEP